MREGSNARGVMGGKGSLLGGVNAQVVRCSAFGASCCQPCTRAGTEMILHKSSLLEGRLFLWARAVSWLGDARLWQRYHSDAWCEVLEQ